MVVDHPQNEIPTSGTPLPSTGIQLAKAYTDVNSEKQIIT